MVTALVVALSACTDVVEGRHLSISDPNEVAGKPVTDGPSGLRPGAPGPVRPIVNSDGGAVDTIAGFGIADVEEFWRAAYGEPLQGTFEPVAGLYSYDSRFKHGMLCGYPTGDMGPNAMWCRYEDENCPSAGGPCVPSFDTIGWDRGILMSDQLRDFGDMGVVAVLAHEYGHAISMNMAGLVTEPGLVAEQVADCLAGVYLRRVVDGESPRFTLNTGDGLAAVLSSQIGAADPLLSAHDPDQQAGRLYHGSPFERVSALQVGFDEGVAACTAIDEAEIEDRRTGLPKELLEDGETGEAPITEDTVRMFVEALTKVAGLDDAPTLAFGTPPCPDATASPPVSYCPATNTIAVELDRLVLMGTSLSRGGPLGLQPSQLFGDFTAFSVLASRYAVAMQEARDGLSTEGTDAGLRTACLTGSLTKKLAGGVDLGEGRRAELDGGDLDEAVVGLLRNGAVAADVDGAYPPSAFARVDAFREGVLGDENDCYATWPK